MNYKLFMMIVFSCVFLLGNIALSDTQNDCTEYPFGVVVGPAGGSSVPSEQQQEFHYKWVRQNGFNIIEHEMLPLAGGWLGWANINDAPNSYKWQAYDSAVADTEQADLQVLLEVTTWNSTPEWLLESHSDAYMQTPLWGSDELTKVIRDEKLDTPTWPSLAHPVVRDAACDFVRRLAMRYRDRKAVRGYIIGEELGLSGIWPQATYYGIDFSPAMRDAYHEHLKKKYVKIKKLNQAWKCPERYKDFSEIIWHKGWAYDPDNYQGEWLEYYQTVQIEFAEFHNALARSIHEADPDAIVMVSAYTMMGSMRVGHGAYLALFKDIDAVAYKSYWHDNRTTIDFCKGITGGKEVWCSNFSERETTTGPVEKQRFLAPRYVRRQLFAGLAHGLKGVFVWAWCPPVNSGLNKMFVLTNQQDDSIVKIPALAQAKDFGDFMRLWWPSLKKFKPTKPQVVCLDANLTFIAQFWKNADPNVARGNWAGSNAHERYISMLNLLVEYSRSFNIATEETIQKILKDKETKVLCLTGCDNITQEVVDKAYKWAKNGKTLIIDDRSGRNSPFGEEIDTLKDFKPTSNILVLQGDRWDRSDKERKRLLTFLNHNIPLDFKVENREPLDVLSVDMMKASDGDELAVAVRNGPMGRPQDKLDISVKFNRNHKKYVIIDPFAAVETQMRTSNSPGGKSVDFVMEGYQDVLLILGTDSVPGLAAKTKCCKIIDNSCSKGGI
jgi:hypothetical protein